MASTTESQANTILIFIVIALFIVIFWEPISRALGISKSGSKESGDQAPANPTQVSDDGKGKCTVYNADGSKVEIEGNLNDPQFDKLCRDSNLNYQYPIYYYGYPYYTIFGKFGGHHGGHH